MFYKKILMQPGYGPGKAIPQTLAKRLTHLILLSEFLRSGLNHLKGALSCFFAHYDKSGDAGYDCSLKWAFQKPISTTITTKKKLDAVLKNSIPPQMLTSSALS